MRVNAQLIDAESGVHLWAEQFDTKRADLLQTQDEIAIHLARAMEMRLRLRRTPLVSNGRPRQIPTPRIWLCQCLAGAQKAGFIGKEADAAYPLCEQALRVDPNNVTALVLLGVKFHTPANRGTSADPKADLARADEFVSHALAVDPTSDGAHSMKGSILFDQGRIEEAMTEKQRAIDLNPANVAALQGWAGAYLFLGQFEQGLETFSKAIELSPRDPVLTYICTRQIVGLGGP